MQCKQPRQQPVERFGVFAHEKSASMVQCGWTAEVGTRRMAVHARLVQRSVTTMKCRLGPVVHQLLAST